MVSKTEPRLLPIGHPFPSSLLLLTSAPPESWPIQGPPYTNRLSVLGVGYPGTYTISFFSKPDLLSDTRFYRFSSPYGHMLRKINKTKGQDKFDKFWLWFVGGVAFWNFREMLTKKKKKKKNVKISIFKLSEITNIISRGRLSWKFRKFSEFSTGEFRFHMSSADIAKQS